MTRRSEIRMSRVRSFSECSRYAVASLAKPWDGRTHIATWIGSVVHARLSNWPEEERPEDVEYDRITSTPERADEAIEKILTGVAAFDERYKPLYIEREMPVATVCGSTRMTGTIDALCEIDGKIVIVDLKTGRKPYTVWLQTAMYAWIANRYYQADKMLMDGNRVKRRAEKDEEPGLEIDALGCLHVPRVGPKTEQRWAYEQRDYAQFAHDVAQWAWTLDQLSQADYEELAATPGMHCARCPVEDCAVRGCEAKR